MCKIRTINVAEYEAIAMLVLEANSKISEIIYSLEFLKRNGTVKIRSSLTSKIKYDSEHLQQRLVSILHLKFT
jgi:hypothetical protein